MSPVAGDPGLCPDNLAEMKAQKCLSGDHVKYGTTDDHIAWIAWSGLAIAPDPENELAVPAAW